MSREDLKDVNLNPLDGWEKACAGVALLAVILGVLGLCVACGGCAYKGGKVVDGTNLAIGMKIPGTDWSVNVLDYVGGVRVAGQDSTHIIVSNEVDETNSYFGVVNISRHSKMTADIEPLETNNTPTEK